MKKILLLGSMLFAFVSFVNAQLVTEGFETGFVNYQNATGNSNQFLIDSTIYHSGTKSAMDVYLPNSIDTLYQSAVVDLSTTVTPQLIFWHICKLEGGFDDGNVLISTDSGLTYTVLPTTAYLGSSTGTDGYATAGHFDEDSYPLWGTTTAPVFNSWWQRESFDLSAYTAFQNVKIMFLLTSDGSVQRAGWFLDDISIENVSCPLVNGLTSFGAGSDTANITWVSGVSDTLWQVEYGVAGFTLGTGTRTLFTTNDTVGLGGLLANSTYDFYVRSICKAGDTSGWKGLSQFITTCMTIAAPYVQNYDLMTISSGNSCYTVDDISDCWSNDLTATNFWQVRSAATTSSSTGPPSDHTSGTGNYVYIETSGGTCSPGDKSTLFSPSIDISGLTNPQLSFYYHMFGTTIDSLNVFISNDNGATWSSSAWSLFGDQGNVWKEGIVSLVPYLGDTIMIKFVAIKGTSFTADIAIDDILVDNVPTCPKPTGITNYTLFSDSVDLTWINGTNDSTWIIEYDTTGFGLGSGTTLSSLNDSVSVGGLMSNTTYDVYLRSFCDVADTSLWVGPYTFTTTCSAFTPPYMEDFTTMAFSTVPSCWKEGTGVLTVNTAVVTGASRWTSDGFANVGFTGAAKMNVCCTGRSEWLISPSIDLGAGAIPYQVEFDVALTDAFGARVTDNGTLGLSDKKIRVVISTDNGVTWSDTNILKSWDSTNIPSFLGEYFYYNLTAAGYTGTVKIGIYVESAAFGESTDFSIDNFAVVQVPTCPRPLSMVFDSATQTTANISWTNGAADSAWILEYGTPGFTLGTGTIYNSATNPAVIPGLMASTCYDVYVKSICTVGDTSIVIGPLNFCTDCAPVTDLCEDFEGYSLGELPICWSNFVSSTSTNANVNIRTFGAFAGSNVMFFGNSNDASATLMLISPEMTAVSAGTHRANFWMRGDSTVIVGTMTDPANPGSFNPIDTIIPTLTYENYKVAFDTYTGTDQHIAFLWSPSNTFDFLNIDEFCFEVIPSCEKAPSVAILNGGVDSTSLNLGWNLDTTQVSYIINYGPAGYDPVTNPTGGQTTTTTTNFVNVGSLRPLTEYCFWVKAVCTNGDTSFWDGPHCDFTGCPSSAAVPYFQDFDNYTFSTTPTCWEEAQGVLTPGGSTLAMGTSNWGPDGFGNVGTTGAARINLYSNNRYEWLVSPSIDLGTNSSGYHIIEFDIALTDYANATAGVVGDDDTLALVVSYNNGLTWSTADILQLFDTSNAPSTTGDHIVYTLINQTGIVKFGFYAASSVSNEDNDWFIDNFSIKDTVFLGIEENEASASFRIFPNPNNGQFTILNEGNANKSSVKIVDIQGRVVYEEAYYFNQNGRKQVDLSKLNSGVYVLILQGEGVQEQHRIILNK